MSEEKPIKEGKILVLNVNQIKPYWRNPKKNEDAVVPVAESISQFGYNSPIIVDTNNVIIAGHTRFKALKLLGVENIRCIVADIDPKKAKEYRIADNKTGEIAEWDMDALIQELREVDIPDMEIFFPDLNLVDLIRESTGTNKWTPVTAESFAKTVESEAAKIDDLTGKRASEVKMVMCPHCGEEFTVV